MEEFCKWINIPTNAVYEYKDNKVFLVLTDEIFRNDYSKFGLVKNKTYRGNPPIDFDFKFLKPFLVGLIDADGTIRVNKKYQRYDRIGLTCSQCVVKWFVKSLKLLGFNGEIKEEYPENKSWGRAVIYKHNSVAKIISILEPQSYFHLSRKWDQLVDKNS